MGRGEWDKGGYVGDRSARGARGDVEDVVEAAQMRVGQAVKLRRCERAAREGDKYVRVRERRQT